MTLASGEIIEYAETHLWYCFGSCEERGKKNDWIFHNAVMRDAIKYYTSLHQGVITAVRAWTDNCAAQFKDIVKQDDTDMRTSLVVF